MNLTRKDKIALANLISVGQTLSNLAFNIGQGSNALAPSCRIWQVKWDRRYSQAEGALRKLQLPPF